MCRASASYQTEAWGNIAFYGYQNINKWIFNDAEEDLLVMSVSPAAVIVACEELIGYKKNVDRPEEKFQFHYGADYDYN